ncbi:MAG: TIGR02452 family protein, partial [Oscillospiraceae bacterium]|nr:TIGR02452 family protein [Oscillospiraceae bacterium]
MPTKEELTACFQDTITVINANSGLLNSTKDSIKNTRIICDKVSDIPQSNGIEANITVVENTTFYAAKEFVYQGRKVAVLNFASAVNPGGGVSQGAMAQEECLCRSSNLLPCLKQNHLMRNYYMPHRIANNPMYSDKIVYTPNVTVFKTDDALPVIMPQNQWFNVDVITCAAPNLRNVDSVDNDEVFSLFCNRIELVLNSAASHGVDTIILGAWGCGAFKNSPEIVAKAFKTVIQNGYSHFFKNIVFAIKGSNSNN